MYAEKTLRDTGFKPHLPRVLLLAHTGKAASLIGEIIFSCLTCPKHATFCDFFLGGTTICGAFDFKFGLKITASGDKKLAELRENLSELRLIIIDKMSLVSSDMLYKIDAKLREIFHLRKDHPFAGIAIVLVGDLLQIPPVKARYIFQQPKYEKSLVLHDIVEHEGNISSFT